MLFHLLRLPHLSSTPTRLPLLIDADRNHGPVLNEQGDCSGWCCILHFTITAVHRCCCKRPVCAILSRALLLDQVASRDNYIATVQNKHTPAHTNTRDSYWGRRDTIKLGGVAWVGVVGWGCSREQKHHYFMFMLLVSGTECPCCSLSTSDDYSDFCAVLICLLAESTYESLAELFASGFMRSSPSY